jgi:hypothetical protein
MAFRWNPKKAKTLVFIIRIALLLLQQNGGKGKRFLLVIGFKGEKVLS